MRHFLSENLYPLFFSLAFIIAISSWFGTSVPPSHAMRELPPEPWSLPRQEAYDSNKSMEAINARNLWGVVAAGEKEAPKWHVLGIARSGVERFIMMAFEGQPVAILKVGDSLPDGARIVKIEEDRFFVMTADKQKLAYGVYKDESAK